MCSAKYFYQISNDLNFIPLWEWTWRHNTSLYARQRFNCACVLVLPNMNTQWHHFNSQSGIKLRLGQIAHNYFENKCVNFQWNSSMKLKKADQIIFVIISKSLSRMTTEWWLTRMMYATYFHICLIIQLPLIQPN